MANTLSEKLFCCAAVVCVIPTSTKCNLKLGNVPVKEILMCKDLSINKGFLFLLFFKDKKIQREIFSNFEKTGLPSSPFPSRCVLGIRFEEDFNFSI